MAAEEDVPEVPFFFRIASEDGQGIIYKAIVERSPGVYGCIGTSKVGVAEGGYTIWSMGRYMDDMPVSSMFEIIDDANITVRSRKQTVAFVRKYELPKYLEKHELYLDDYSYWFVDPTFTGRLRKTRKTKRRKLRKMRKTRR
jgi:hypothetical protein